MVRVELGGKPLIDIEAKPGEIGKVREHIRRRIRGGGRSTRFAWTNITPRLVITSDTSDFDEEILRNFEAEGFQVAYLAYDGDHNDYQNKLLHIADSLDVGDQYAIVAYGDAAALCLETCSKSMGKLAAVVAYYPPYMPKNINTFPSPLQLIIHLAGNQKFGTREPSFRYPNTQPGFAESDLDEYDKINANIAWSRTIGLLRRTFDLEADLESIWEGHLAQEFGNKDADATMKTMTKNPYVNHVPTMTGGIGAKELHRFYQDFFIPHNPPNMKMTLVSRTVGVDRVVDEIYVKFRHSTEIVWMLPGIPPTDKNVEVVVVSIVCMRGSKIYHEHLHWDQASVLVQIGLLDPKYIPSSFKTSEEGKEKEVKRLPVVGVEAARKCADEKSSKSNQLIPNWKTDS